MKKLLLLSSLCIALYATGFTQCAPNAPTGLPGFCPAASAFPCIERGEPFNAVLHFENFDSMGPVVITTIRIDSITDLPAGISYGIFPGSTVTGGGTACILFSGNSNVPAGNYNFGFYVTITIAGIGTFDGELSQIMQDMFSLGLLDTSTTDPIPFTDPYYLRVIEPGTPCPSSGLCFSQLNFVSGKVFFDENGNGIMDGLDNAMENVRVEITPPQSARYTNEQGIYFAHLDSGTFTVSVSPPQYFSVSAPATPYNIPLNGTNLSSLNNDFGLTATTIVHDVSAVITSGNARPGRLLSHWIHYQNEGSAVESGTITCTFDPVLFYISSSPVAASQNGNVVTWTFANLYPGEQQEVYLMLDVPVNAALGDTLISSVEITIPDTDVNPRNNQSAVIEVITGSYDPNDKLVYPDDKKNGIRPDEMLTYTVRFQNTGTDTAFTVVIRDTLDNMLDAENFKTVAASHPYSFQLEGNKYAIWTFDNILLPDSGINEPLSHGFVKYVIGFKGNVPDNSTVKNNASIYFDFNDPVKTNTVESRVDFNSGIRPQELVQSNLFPNPTSGAFTLLLSRNISDFELQVLDVSGKLVQSHVGLSGDKVVLDSKALDNGIYLYRVVSDGKAVAHGKLVVVK